MKVPGSARGTEQVKLSGGRGRLDVYGRGVGSFDELLGALNGGDHPNDLIVKGFGRTRLLPQDVGVRGKADFTIQILH